LLPLQLYNSLIFLVIADQESGRANFGKVGGYPSITVRILFVFHFTQGRKASIWALLM
jgi:hypothetical protein